MTNLNGADKCTSGAACANCPSSHPHCDTSVGLCSAFDASSPAGNISKLQQKFMSDFFWKNCWASHEITNKSRKNEFLYLVEFVTLKNYF